MAERRVPTDTHPETGARVLAHYAAASVQALTEALLRAVGESDIWVRLARGVHTSRSASLAELSSAIPSSASGTPPQPEITLHIFLLIQASLPLGIRDGWTEIWTYQQLSGGLVCVRQWYNLSCSFLITSRVLGGTALPGYLVQQPSLYLERTPF